MVPVEPKNWSIRIPGYSAISHGWHKLDNIAVLWERLPDAQFKSFRCLMADSSLKQYNYFCTRESSFRVPSDFLESELLDLDQHVFQKYWKTFAWQCTVLGYGAGNLAFKFRNIVHSILLKCNTSDELQEYRESVVGFTSDQGTERKLADCAFAVKLNLESLKQIAHAVHEEELPLASEETLQSYMFPYCLIMFGHIHMLMNGLEHAVLSSKMWGSNFSDGLQALLTFLNSKGLRQRFVALCMAHAPLTHKKMFDNFSKQHLDWRWESLANLLNHIVPLIPFLIQYWTIETMRGEDSANVGTIDAACLAEVEKFLKRQWVEASLEMFRMYSRYGEGLSVHPLQPIMFFCIRHI